MSMDCLRHATWVAGCPWCERARVELAELTNRNTYSSWQATADGRAYSAEWEQQASALASKYMVRERAWAALCAVAAAQAKPQPAHDPRRTMSSMFGFSLAWAGFWTFILFGAVLVGARTGFLIAWCVIGYGGTLLIWLAEPVVALRQMLANRRMAAQDGWFDPNRPETLPAWWATGDPREATARVLATRAAVRSGEIQAHIGKMPLDQMGVTVSPPRPALPQVLNDQLLQWAADDAAEGSR